MLVRRWLILREMVTDYWNPDLLPTMSGVGHASVTYGPDDLSEELGLLDVCNMDASFNSPSDYVKNPFAGDYTYRAMFNSLHVDDDFEGLVMGKGTFRLNADGPNKIKGTLEGVQIGAILNVTGEITGEGDDARMHMIAVVDDYGGVIGNNWEYHYQVYKTKDWPNAIDQDGMNNRGILVGTVARHIDGHDGGKVHQQGAVGSFFMVKM